MKQNPIFEINKNAVRSREKHHHQASVLDDAQQLYINCSALFKPHQKVR